MISPTIGVNIHQLYTLVYYSVLVLGDTFNENNVINDP